MTLEEVYTLIPGKDYVIHKNEIRRFMELEFPIVKLYETQELRVLSLVKDCQLLSKYRGSFDKSILPPKDESEVSESVDVIIKDSHGSLYIGWYAYVAKEWMFYGGYPTPEEFRWCFKPDYL